MIQQKSQNSQQENHYSSFNNHLEHPQSEMNIDLGADEDDEQFQSSLYQVHQQFQQNRHQLRKNQIYSNGQTEGDQVGGPGKEKGKSNQWMNKQAIFLPYSNPKLSSNLVNAMWDTKKLSRIFDKKLKGRSEIVDSQKRCKSHNHHHTQKDNILNKPQSQHRGKGQEMFLIGEQNDTVEERWNQIVADINRPDRIISKQRSQKSFKRRTESTVKKSKLSPSQSFYFQTPMNPSISVSNSAQQKKLSSNKTGYLNKDKSKSVGNMGRVNTFNGQYQRIKKGSKANYKIDGNRLIETFAKPEVKEKITATNSLLKVRKQTKPQHPHAHTQKNPYFFPNLQSANVSPSYQSAVSPSAAILPQVESSEVNNKKIDPVDLYQIKNNLAEEQYKQIQAQIKAYESTYNFSQHYIISRGQIYIKQERFENGQNKNKQFSSVSFKDRFAANSDEKEGSFSGSNEYSMYNLNERISNPDETPTEGKQSKTMKPKEKPIASIANLEVPLPQDTMSVQQIGNETQQDSDIYVKVQTQGELYANTKNNEKLKVKGKRKSGENTNVPGFSKEENVEEKEDQFGAGERSRVERSLHFRWRQFANQVHAMNFGVILWQKVKRSSHQIKINPFRAIDFSAMTSPASNQVNFKNRKAFNCLCTSIRVIRQQLLYASMQKNSLPFNFENYMNEMQKKEQVKKQSMWVKFSVVLDYVEDIEMNYQKEKKGHKKNMKRSRLRSKLSYNDEPNEYEYESDLKRSLTDLISESQPLKSSQPKFSTSTSNVILHYEFQVRRRQNSHKTKMDYFKQKLLFACLGCNSQEFKKYLGKIVEMLVVGEAINGKRLQVEELESKDDKDNKLKKKLQVKNFKSLNISEDLESNILSEQHVFGGDSLSLSKGKFKPKNQSSRRESRRESRRQSRKDHSREKKVKILNETVGFGEKNYYENEIMQNEKEENMLKEENKPVVVDENGYDERVRKYYRKQYSKGENTGENSKQFGQQKGHYQEEDSFENDQRINAFKLRASGNTFLNKTKLQEIKECGEIEQDEFSISPSTPHQNHPRNSIQLASQTATQKFLCSNNICPSYTNLSDKSQTDEIGSLSWKSKIHRVLSFDSQRKIQSEKQEDDEESRLPNSVDPSLSHPYSNFRALETGHVLKLEYEPAREKQILCKGFVSIYNKYFLYLFKSYSIVDEGRIIYKLKIQIVHELLNQTGNLPLPSKANSKSSTGKQKRRKRSYENAPLFIIEEEFAERQFRLFEFTYMKDLLEVQGDENIELNGKFFKTRKQLIGMFVENVVEKLIGEKVYGIKKTKAEPRFTAQYFPYMTANKTKFLDFFLKFSKKQESQQNEKLTKIKVIECQQSKIKPSVVHLVSKKFIDMRMTEREQSQRPSNEVESQSTKWMNSQKEQRNNIKSLIKFNSLNEYIDLKSGNKYKAKLATASREKTKPAVFSSFTREMISEDFSEQINSKKSFGGVYKKIEELNKFHKKDPKPTRISFCDDADNQNDYRSNRNKTNSDNYIVTHNKLLGNEDKQGQSGYMIGLHNESDNLDGIEDHTIEYLHDGDDEGSKMVYSFSRFEKDRVMERKNVVENKFSTTNPDFESMTFLSIDPEAKKKESKKFNSFESKVVPKHHEKKVSKAYHFYNQSLYCVNFLASCIYGIIDSKMFYKKINLKNEKQKFRIKKSLETNLKFNKKWQQSLFQKPFQEQKSNSYEFYIHEHISEEKKKDYLIKHFVQTERRASILQGRRNSLQGNTFLPVSNKSMKSVTMRSMSYRGGLFIKCVTGKDVFENEIVNELNSDGFQMFERPMQTTYYTTKRIKSFRPNSKDEEMIRFVIMPLRSLKNYFLDMTSSQIYETLQSNTSLSVFSGQSENLPQVEQYAKKLKKYPSLLYSHYGLSPPAYSIIYRKTKKLCAGMYILFTVMFVDSMGCGFIKAYIHWIQKCFYFKLSIDRFKMSGLNKYNLTNSQPIFDKYWEEIIEIYTQRFKTVYFKKNMDIVYQKLQQKNSELYNMLMNKNNPPFSFGLYGNVNSRNNNNQVLGGGARMRRNRDGTRNNENNKVLDDDELILRQQMAHKYVTDSEGRVFLILIYAICQQPKNTKNTNPNKRYRHSTEDEESLEGTKNTVKVEILQANRFSKLQYFWNFHNQARPAGQEPMPNLQKGSQSGFGKSSKDIVSSNYGQHEEESKNFGSSPMRMYKYLLKNIMKLIKEQISPCNEYLVQKFKLLFKSNSILNNSLSNVNNAMKKNDQSSLKMYSNGVLGYMNRCLDQSKMQSFPQISQAFSQPTNRRNCLSYIFFKKFKNGHWILFETSFQDQIRESTQKAESILSSNKRDSERKMKGEQVEEIRRKRILIEQMSSRKKKEIQMPNIGFQGCVPLTQYNKRLARRVTRVISQTIF